ncbi:MAG: adenosine kinase [Bacteriodetes bacterium]|nr:adenosine kinase [Bacteroidota bacterium]
MKMKDLHVVALGNALVDVEYQISNEELEQTGLRKGGMTLASADEQQALLQTLADKKGYMSSGGSAANSIIAFGQFGGRGAYKSVLGNDELGHFYANEFSELGLELFADKNSDHPTGTCVVLITPDAERTMQTSLGVNSLFDKHQLVEDSIKRAEWLYVEGYKFTDDKGAEAIEEAIFYAKKYDTKVAVTFSDTFIVMGFRDVLNKAAAEADLIFANEFEAKAYAETENMDEAFAMLASNMPNVAITLGDKGAKIKVGSSIVEIPSYPTTVINTNGAGDMFAGGFLYGITHGLTPEKAGKLASYASSKVVAQHGARLRASHIDVRNDIVAGVVN